MPLRNDVGLPVILIIHHRFSIRYRWDIPQKIGLDRTIRKPCPFIILSNAPGTGNLVTESRRYR